ncbi:MAG: 23S rRNA (adenine(2503)-C(2))-methyltransferase RlmN, partial [Bacteroidota bacterium]
MSKEALQQLVVDLGQPKFRGKQIHEWLWKKSATSFDSMSNLPLAFRQMLNERFIIRPIEIDKTQRSLDGTIKTRFRLH